MWKGQFSLIGRFESFVYPPLCVGGLGQASPLVTDFHEFHLPRIRDVRVVRFLWSRLNFVRSYPRSLLIARRRVESVVA